MERPLIGPTSHRKVIDNGTLDFSEAVICRFQSGIIAPVQLQLDTLHFAMAEKIFPPEYTFLGQDRLIVSQNFKA